MSGSNQIELELRAYLEGDSNLSQQDKFIHLKAIFDKHFTMNKTGHLINYEDFHDIIADAKRHYSNISLPMRLSKKEIYATQVNNISMIESTIGHLNKMHLLNKMVNLDYTK